MLRARLGQLKRIAKATLTGKPLAPRDALMLRTRLGQLERIAKATLTGKPLAPRDALMLRAWRGQLVRILEATLSGESRAPLNYQKLHVDRVRSYCDFRGKKVLVVGCNRGTECRYFVDAGAGEVHGLDVIDDIGIDYAHPTVRYHKTSAEEMELPDDDYDLVHSLATMEHVANIDAAYPEMVRVTKPGGLVYCVASPLWHSRNGHHKGEFFADYPWIHLLMDQEEIVQLCRERGIEDPQQRASMRDHVAYMLNPLYFNKRPAKDYVSICTAISGVEILENRLDLEDDDVLPEQLATKLASRGYSRAECLAETHYFIARKRRRP